MIRSHTRELSAPYDSADGDGDELNRLAFKADGYFYKATQ